MKRMMLAGLALAVLALCGCSKQPATPTVASGQSGSPKATQTANAVAIYLQAMRKYAQCLRAAGLDVADPDPQGNIDLGSVKSSGQGRAAAIRCGKDLPPHPDELNPPKQPQTAAQIEKARQYARCMQANGAPDFPDPGPDGYFDGDTTWDQTTAGAARATRLCTPIVQGSPVPGSG
jgi:hypothetical protein